MENNYWIIDEWLIFKPSFNEDLTNYYDVINKYEKIMFSNYNDPLIAIKTNNEWNREYLNNYIESDFNQKIDLSNNINLTHLTFGYYFNQKIDLSNNIHLTHLTLGNFNQEINLSNNINLTHLTHLTFKGYFNQEIDLLNNINLTHLTFGKYFNQEIFIPFNIKSLNMYCCNNQYIIDNLHNNIEELTIYQTNLNLNNLPNSIKKIYIENYNKELNNIPNSIEYLELINYNLKIKKIPKNLKTVRCSNYYKYIDDFKNYAVITY